MNSQPVIRPMDTTNVTAAVATMPPTTAQGLLHAERLPERDELAFAFALPFAGTAMVWAELSRTPSSGTVSTSVSPLASRSTIFFTPSRVCSRPLVYRVPATAASTLATAAPASVPATPS